LKNVACSSLGHFAIHRIQDGEQYWKETLQAALSAMALQARKGFCVLGI